MLYLVTISDKQDANTMYDAKYDINTPLLSCVFLLIFSELFLARLFCQPLKGASSVITK